MSEKKHRTMQTQSSDCMDMLILKHSANPVITWRHGDVNMTSFRRPVFVWVSLNFVMAFVICYHFHLIKYMYLYFVSLYSNCVQQ